MTTIFAHQLIYGTAFDEAVQDKTQARRVFRNFKDGLCRRSPGSQARTA